MARVRLISGGPRSDRAAQIDSLLLDRLGESLLIVPTDAYARRRAAALLARAGRRALLDPPVITFGELVGRILRSSTTRTRRIAPLEQRILLARAAAQAREKGLLDSLGAAADSEGFLDHLLNIINQLKQAAIEPKQFWQRVRSRRNAMDAIVAEVYTAYQDELNHAAAVDLPGMYWLARIECEKAAPPAGLNAVRHIALDDFDDFTPSEFGVIEALAQHLDSLVFGLNLSADPEQQSLYAAPLQTARKIRDRFESAAFDDPQPEPPPRRKSEFIGASMLVRKTLPAPGALENDVEFVECHTLEHEIESIARRIKHLVRSQSADLPSIAVVWRNPAAVAAPMRDIFREFGIPLAGLETRTLSESAIAGFILRFIDAAQTWSPESVLDVLTSPCFAGCAAPHAAAFPLLLRAARVRPTEKGWRDGIDRLARYLDDPQQLELKRLRDHLPHAVEACAALRGAVDRFRAQAKSISGAVPIRSRTEILESLIAEWRLPGTVADMPAGGEQDFENAALPALADTLAVLREGHAADAERRSLAAFAKTLRHVFAASSAGLKPKTGVACLGMEPARYLGFDFVFLAGLSDSQVPAGRKLNAIYSDEDRQDLDSAGVALDRADAHNQHEILLFQRMFAIARCHTVASWHRLSPGGATLQRSLYLNEVADRLGGLHERTTTSPHDALVPPPALAACTRDAQNLRVPLGCAGHFPAIAAAARMETQRYGFDRFDAHDGALAAPDTLAQLAGDYSPTHVFSASQLEAYAECPFRFFQERILKLFAIEPAEQAFDHLVRGSVLHAALEGFHSAHIKRTLAEIPEDEAAAAMNLAAGTAFDHVAQRVRNLAPGLLAAERARTLATLQRHLRLARESESKESQTWRPLRLEEAFGADDSSPPYTLEIGELSILLQGKIDRIDEGEQTFRLIDYKSSKVKAKAITQGKVFQLALYALACEAAILPGSTCADAHYLGIGDRKGPTLAFRKTGDKSNWDERIAIARTAVAEAVEGIRTGRFHPTQSNERCRGCHTQKVCRFERGRVQRKPPPR